jgi:hypothetical protein
MKFTCSKTELEKPMSTGAQFCSNVQLDTLISSELTVNADVQFRTVSPLKCAFTHFILSFRPQYRQRSSWRRRSTGSAATDSAAGGGGDTQEVQLPCHFAHRLQIG